jgi:excisionase family DNA binding protein
MKDHISEMKLLTTFEAQNILSIGRTRLFRLIGSGEIESVLIGSSRRIPASAIKKFIEKLLADSAR